MILRQLLSQYGTSLNQQSGHVPCDDRPAISVVGACVPQPVTEFSDCKGAIVAQRTVILLTALCQLLLNANVDSNNSAWCKGRCQYTVCG